MSYVAFSIAVFIFQSSSATLAAAPGSESPQSFTYQGRFLNSAGTSALTGIVSIKFTILNSAANCILYEETQSGINLGVTGNFAVSVGSGIRTPIIDPGLAMNQVFANSNPQPGPAPVLVAASANCAAGYTPTVGEQRLLRVSVT